MSIRTLNPYLNLNGTAQQAIELYKSALGASAENLMRWGDAPGADVAPENKNRIMHCLLRVGEGVMMIADTPPGVTPASDGNVQVCLHFDDLADMTRKFNALASGGKVTMQLQETFWGANFGMLTDAHGVRWMFNCEINKA